MDPALEPFLRATGDDAERCLAALLGGDTDRTIRAIVGRTLCGPSTSSRAYALEAEDVRADVLVHILTRLRRLKAGPEQTPIGNFSGYVASIAYRTCFTHLRRLYPQRARLKNRLRYALTCDPDLSLEQDALGIWRCGLTSWNDEPPARIDVDHQAAQEFRSRPGAFARGVMPDFADQQIGIADAVKVLLERIRQPTELDLLVDGIGGMLGVDDRRPAWSSTEELDAALDAPDPRQSIAQTLMHRQYLAGLWAEVRELPLNQRIAILLNLRDEDGGSALPMLPLTGIATIRQIAEVLDMPALELAGLWPELPLDDARIAKQLGLQRQKVINLRKSGRERLGRRMARYGW